MTCRCGHTRWDHRGKAGCTAWVDEDGGSRVRLDEAGFAVLGGPCGCKTYDDSLLPAEGSRLEFGVHHLRSDVAETAEAWPPVSEHVRRVRRDTDRKAGLA